MQPTDQTATMGRSVEWWIEKLSECKPDAVLMVYGRMGVSPEAANYLETVDNMVLILP